MKGLLLPFALLGACTESLPQRLGSTEPDASTTDAAIHPVLDASSDAPVDAPVVLVGTVDGDVRFPDGGATNQTSVLLARVTDYELNGFHTKLPDGPRLLGVTGAWSISDVPPGDYWVLVGYANDGLVSAHYAPTQLHVSGSPGEVVHSGTHYVRRALEITTISPKASAASVTIVDTEGEDEYRVTVHDFMNQLVYQHSELPSQTGEKLTFAIGKVLTVPIHYRVRVLAMKNGSEVTRTEDLEGIFTAQPDDT